MRQIEIMHRVLCAQIHAKQHIALGTQRSIEIQYKKDKVFLLFCQWIVLDITTKNMPKRSEKNN